MSRIAYRLTYAVLFCSVCVSACSDDPTDPNSTTGLSGTLDIPESSSAASIVTIDLSSGTVASTLDGQGPHRTPEGTVLMVRGNGDLVEATTTQERVIAAENTEYPNAEAYDDRFENPRLSPNGRLVAYAGTFLDYAVYVVDRATGDLQFGIEPTTSLEGFRRPSWISDTEILVSGYLSNPGLYVIDIETGDGVRIDDDLASPTDPVVSPDRSRVAFILNNHVWIMDLDGTRLRQISTSSGEEKMPTWSPDGKWILVSNAASLYAVSVDGNNVVDIMKEYRADRSYLGSTQTSWR